LRRQIMLITHLNSSDGAGCSDHLSDGPPHFRYLAS
jgi:hypothetical protein